MAAWFAENVFKQYLGTVGNLLRFEQYGIYCRFRDEEIMIALGRINVKAVILSKGGQNEKMCFGQA